MAGLIGPLPPIHLTARAYVWTTKAEVWHPGRAWWAAQKVSVAKAQCGATYLTAWPTISMTFEHPSGPIARDWSCTTEDVRAMQLEQTKAVHQDFDGAFYVGVYVRDIIFPTCRDCKVWLDKALENSTKKTGRYLTARRDKYSHAMVTTWTNPDVNSDDMIDAMKYTLRSMGDYLHSPVIHPWDHIHPWDPKPKKE